jgi:hypothetical protein
MSQSVRTPKGIAIRAVAAAALYASKQNSQQPDEKAMRDKRAPVKKISLGNKRPEPKQGQ